MSDFSDIINDFDDWKKETGIVYQLTQIRNAAGQTEDSESVVQSGIEFWRWTDQSLQTNVSDKFVDRETGNILLDPETTSFTPNVNMWIINAAGIRYNIEGVDNIGAFTEVYKLSYTREYK